MISPFLNPQNYHFISPTLKTDRASFTLLFLVILGFDEALFPLDFIHVVENILTVVCFSEASEPGE